MPLQGVNISIGTQIRSGSTMINTHWHAKNRCPTVILLHITGWKNLNWSSCLNKGNFTKMPTEYLYLSSTKNTLPRNMKVPVVQRWGPLVKISKWTQLLQLCWEVIRKTRINESFQPLYPVTAWMKKLLQKARVTAPTRHQEVHITILFFVLKAASKEHNVIRVLCGDINCCLPARVLRVQN